MKGVLFLHCVYFQGIFRNLQPLMFHLCCFFLNNGLCFVFSALVSNQKVFIYCISRAFIEIYGQLAVNSTHSLLSFIRISSCYNILLLSFMHCFVFRPESLGIVVGVVFLVVAIIFQYFNFTTDSNVSDVLYSFFFISGFSRGCARKLLLLVVNDADQKRQSGNMTKLHKDIVQKNSRTVR